MNAPGESYRVIVTGWRDWPREGKYFIWAELDRLRSRFGLDYWPAGAVTIAQGECPYGGVDLWAKEWAEFHHQLVDPFPAEWDKLGKAAGPRRNTVMVGNGANLCLGFPGPNSKGTWDCLEKATNAGIETYARSWFDLIRFGGVEL